MALTYVVDGYSILTKLARDNLLPADDWLVQTRVPDDIPSRLVTEDGDPRVLLVIRRTGGGVERNFHGFMERWLCAYSLWFQPGTDWIALGQAISKVFFEAWAGQTVTPAGHIAHCRNGVGWEDVSDPELPLYGRAIAQYEFLLRPPRPS